jgi:O-methyltransferase/aklanonic acid methyltransferase
MHTPAEHKASVARLYDTIAAAYDQVGPPFYARNGERLVALLALRPGERVLDAGCGRGACLLPAAEAIGSGGSAAGSAIGIDGSARMVELVTAEAHRRGLSNVYAMVGDAEAPEFDAESFDAVLSGFVLRLLPDPGAALRAYLRLLRPGGRLGVTFYAAGFGPRWRPVEAELEAFLPGGQPATGSQLDSTAAFAALLGEAGFDAVRVDDQPFDVAFPDVAAWWDYLWSSGYRGMMERIPPADRDRAREVLCAAAAPMREADGSLVMDVKVRYATAVRPFVR